MAYRYLGNKSRLADRIVDTVCRIADPGEHIADLMTGTASVAHALNEAGFKVTAADELTFPVLHARARIALDRPPEFLLLGGYSSVISRLNQLAPTKGFFHREYGDAGRPSNGKRSRMYFTSENAGRIDAIRACVAEWHEAEVIDDRERELILHDLILAANSVANIAGTYGYFRSSWSSTSLAPLELTPTCEFLGSEQNKVLQGRVEELISKIDADVVYLDPPYTKRQYAGNYHILETLAVGDEFEPVGDGGLREWQHQSSDFCSKRSVESAFRRVLEGCRARAVVLSYSDDGQLPIAALESLLNEYGGFTCERIEIPRFRSNAATSKAAATERIYSIELSAIEARSDAAGEHREMVLT